MAAGVSLAAFSSPSSPGSQAGNRAGGAGTASASAARPPQSAPPAASPVTGPAITSAGIAKTALKYPPALKAEVLRWRVGRGGAAWSAVTAQLGTVTQAAGARLYPDLRLDCRSLASSVRAAQAGPAIPDQVMQRLYAGVLAGLSGVAADCSAAISVRPDGDEGQQITVDKAVLNRALGQFSAESKQLYTATAEIRTLRP